MNLNGKNVVLTGASSGIGLEVLYKLIEKECKVIAVSRNIEKIPNNKNVYPFKCDVANKKDLDKLFDFALDCFDKIDVFISNAGFAYYEKIDDADYEHIEKIYKTNVFAPIYCLERMNKIYEGKGFTFVITASAMAKMPLPGYALYCSTKAAIDFFHLSYRFEMGKFNLIVVYPIATRTNFFNTSKKTAPVPFPAQPPEHVANCIIKGIEKNKKHVYPSKTFIITNVLSKVFPFISALYQKVQYKKLKKWLEGN